VGQNRRRPHQIRVDGDAARVVEIGPGDGGAVDFALAHQSFHGAPPTRFRSERAAGCRLLPSFSAPLLYRYSAFFSGAYAFAVSFCHLFDMVKRTITTARRRFCERGLEMRGVREAEGLHPAARPVRL